MDNFGVPKKINRHVLKALYYMKDCGSNNIRHSDICELVEYTMKNNVPVRNLPGTVQQSLENMAELGVIEKIGSNFCVRNIGPSSLNPKTFRPHSRKSDHSQLDPNIRKRHHESDDSMSGSEIEMTRKRFSSSKPIKRKGRTAELPKVRKSDQNFELPQDNCSYEEFYNKRGDEGMSIYSLSTDLGTQLFSEISKEDMDGLQLQNRQLIENIENLEQFQDTNDERFSVMVPTTEANTEEVATADENVENKAERNAYFSDNREPVLSKTEEHFSQL